MATIAQGIEAGNLANGLNSLTAFIQALQAAVNAGAQVSGLSIGVSGSIPSIVFFPPGNLSVSDSAALLNELISLSNGLSSEWTATLASL
jgi:hypothetical protein